ncbi:unnamed protein product [Adineta steineri]|uniref:Uncharacterized protein n=1 Tax=Adineta steineri TaxID=433720 RepID=A0A819IA91_9BILA|nr:unnamed protein product [Adineta steineri]CAF3913248.1 unnamed protein product [Adineta steineri]
MYMPIQCGIGPQRLLLLAFDMNEKIYNQSQWILHSGNFAYLFYDPKREHLFGLRDDSISTLIMEEYDMKTLNVIRNYTQQTSSQYAIPRKGSSMFDYEDNWIVEVRTRLDPPLVKAYYIKMDLNLIGKKEDIVTEFHQIPNLDFLLTMTYDMKTKNILATRLSDPINNNNLIMLYMNPFTSKITNEKLLLKTPSGWVVSDVQAVYDASTRQILFMIHHKQVKTLEDKYWIIFIDFDTMEIKDKKQDTPVQELETWKLFTL